MSDEKKNDELPEEIEPEAMGEPPVDEVSEEISDEAEIEAEAAGEDEEAAGGPAMSRLEKVAAVTQGQIRGDIPEFRPGDTVKVHVKIVEGNKERLQAFEGVVIAMKHGGIDRTFTVRKTSWGVGVERTFFINSPKIDKITVTRKGHVRRAKLYYLRERAGKSARIKERRMTGE